MKRLIWLFSLSLYVGMRAADYSYQYDAAGRLVSASLPQSQSITYSYDPAGNIVAQGFGAVVDSDQDSLPDEWELRYFGSLAQDGAGDFDHDGFSNFQEYLAGTDPAVSSSLMKIVSINVSGSGGVELRVATVAGKKYQLQSKNSLSDSNWTNRENIQATGGTFTWVDATGGSATRFYRVLLVP